MEHRQNSSSTELLDPSPDDACAPATESRAQAGGLWAAAKPLMLLAVLAMVAFSAFRLGLAIANRPLLGDPPAGQVALCLLQGLAYDLVPTSLLLLPLGAAMLGLPSRLLDRRGVRRAVNLYMGIAVAAVLLLEYIGMEFFRTFHCRLNQMVFYMSNAQEMWTYLWEGYPFVTVTVAMIAIAAGGYLLLGRLTWRRWLPAGTSLGRRVALVTMVVLAATAGAVAWSSDVGPAGAPPSSNHLLEELSHNNFVTLCRAVNSQLGQAEQELSLYDFPPHEQAYQTTRTMVSQKGVKFAGGASPLWRTCPSGKAPQDYNVVIILMEGMAGKAVGALGNSPSYTPFLDSLARESAYCERMYATGSRTNRGMVGVLGGHVDTGTKSVLAQPRAQGRFLTLPQVLKQRGYRTMFFYGGKPSFDNMEEFLSRGGMDEIVGKEQLPEGGFCTSSWGYADEVVLDEAHRRFAAMGKQRFFSVVLTVSNHEPYEIPQNRTKLLPNDGGENTKLNAYIYSDWALRQFFAKARKSEYFKNTLFVLVADHGRFLDPRPVVDVPGFRVPCLFYGPSIVGPQRIAPVCSQVDIAPTILALLGGDSEHCFLGRNLFAMKPSEGFALLHQDDRLAFVEGDAVILQAPRSPSQAALLRQGELVMQEGPLTAAQQQHRQRMLSYYYCALDMFLSGTYRAADK